VLPKIVIFPGEMIEKDLVIAVSHEPEGWYLMLYVVPELSPTTLKAPVEALTLTFVELKVPPDGPKELGVIDPEVLSQIYVG